MAGDDLLDVRDRWDAAPALRVHRVQDLEREAPVDRSLGERVERDDPDQSAPSSERMLSVTRCAIRSRTSVSAELDLIESDALTQDGDAGGVVRRPDDGRQSRLEPFPEALLDRDERPRQTIAGQNQLPPGLIQGVEGVEELLLGPGLAREELDVVDEQDVGVAVGALEPFERPRSEGADEVVRERLGRGVANRGSAAEHVHIVADRMEEVGLAEPRRRVQEQRVEAWPGSSATASAAAWARRLPSPMMNCSKRYRG